MVDSSKKIIIESAFDTFISKAYLRTYYSKIGSENHGLLNFFAKIFKNIEGKSRMLEFGGGPCVFSLIAAAPKVKDIHFSDYLDHNLSEVKLWQEDLPSAFNWDKFFRRVLYLEGYKKVSKKMIERRKKITRNKMTKFLKCDAFKKDPIGKEYRNYYDIISTNFVVESITDKQKTWKRLVSNLSSMLKKDGVLIMTAIKGADYYHVGKKRFPATNINESHIAEVLSSLGFDQTSFLIETVPAEVLDAKSEGYTGYTGLVFAMAKK